MNHIPLKVLGILVFNAVIKVDICGPELAGGTYSMQGKKCEVEHQLLGGQNKVDSYLSSSWCLIDCNLQRGWQHIKILGYTRSSPQLPLGGTSPAGTQNCTKAFKAHGPTA